jgi:ferredoxin
MPTVTFILVDGQIKRVETPEGERLLRVALDNNVPMEYACGGNGFCTTCMCSVEEGDREENMGVTDDPHRLGCQATVEGDVTVKLLDI